MAFLQLPKNNWAKVLPKYVDKQHMVKLNHQVEKLYQQNTVLPEQNSIFKALNLTDYPNVKVVILGQDPYPNPENAMGLAFSVKPKQSVPLSLQNIYKERYHDLGIPPTDNGDLTNWAKQGVLLLNTTLTVNTGQSGSHQDIGWTEFTDGVIKALNHRKQPVVYLLWGKHAQSKKELIEKTDQTLILESSHPSPFSARISFLGSHPFSKTNHFLVAHSQEPINWDNDYPEKSERNK